MKIAIIGSSGFVGSRLVNESIRRGHIITAISRTTENIPSDSSVSPVSLDVRNKDALAETVKGHDAVLTAFHPGRDQKNQRENYIQGHKTIQEAVEKAGVDRWLVIGGAGSLYIEEGVQLVDTPQFPEDFREEASVARDYLTQLQKETGLEWTYLSPAILMHPGIDTGRTGSYRTNTDTPVFDDNGESKISAEDLAVAMLDKFENKKYIQKRFTVGY